MLTSSGIVTRAERIVGEARCFDLPATGEVLLEIESDPFHLWEIAPDRLAAREALCKRVADHLRKGCARG